MTPGPTLFKKCTACSGLIEQHTINSGNTFGATFWTDGRQEAPMLPDQLWLVMCPHCDAPLWIDELEEVGRSDPWDEKADKFEGAKDYKEPALDDYLALADKGLDDRRKERYVRLRAWWAGNDVRRAGDLVPLSSREAGNLEALAGMLEESSPNDLVMKAEAMRELGRFDDVLSLLAKSADRRLAQAAEIIRGLSQQRDPHVRQMHFK